MTTTICGHDRTLLRGVLEFANGSNLDGISRDWPRPEDPTPTEAAMFDVYNADKLAAIIANILRNGSIETLVFAYGARATVGPSLSEDVAVIYYTVGHGGTIQVYPPHTSRSSVFAVPQARALVIRMLDAPNTDIARILEEVTR